VIPAAIQKMAAKCPGTVGRATDSAGSMSRSGTSRRTATGGACIAVLHPGCLLCCVLQREIDGHKNCTPSRDG
jgi:hypothetical protein